MAKRRFSQKQSKRKQSKSKHNKLKHNKTKHRRMKHRTLKLINSINKNKIRYPKKYKSCKYPTMHPNALKRVHTKPNIKSLVIKSTYSNIDGRKNFKFSSMKNNGNKITILENVNGVMKKRVIPKKHNIYSILNSKPKHSCSSCARQSCYKHIHHKSPHHSLQHLHNQPHRGHISTLLPNLFSKS